MKRDTDAIAGSASPRKPNVAMPTSSAALVSLLVAWRSSASTASSRPIPMPSSLTCTSVLPPVSISTRTCRAPASMLFSTSSFTTDAGRSTTSPAAIWSATASGRMAIRRADVVGRVTRRIYSPAGRDRAARQPAQFLAGAAHQHPALLLAFAPPPPTLMAASGSSWRGRAATHGAAYPRWRARSGGGPTTRWHPAIDAHDQAQHQHHRGEAADAPLRRQEQSPARPPSRARRAAVTPTAVKGGTLRLRRARLVGGRREQQRPPDGAVARGQPERREPCRRRRAILALPVTRCAETVPERRIPGRRRDRLLERFLRAAQRTRRIEAVGRHLRRGRAIRRADKQQRHRAGWPAAQRVTDPVRAPGRRRFLIGRAAAARRSIPMTLHRIPQRRNRLGRLHVEPAARSAGTSRAEVAMSSRGRSFISARSSASDGSSDLRRAGTDLGRRRRRSDRPSTRVAAAARRAAQPHAGQSLAHLVGDGRPRALGSSGGGIERAAVASLPAATATPSPASVGTT